MDELASRFLYNAAIHVMDAWMKERRSDAYFEGQLTAYSLLNQVSKRLDPLYKQLLCNE